MDALRCPPPDADVSVLSGGEKRRVALCKLLLEKPDLLLLDEPTNHLDAESVLWLEQHLAKYPGAVIAVTHDRYFLDNVAEWIVEVDRGRALPLRGQLLDLPREEGRAPQGPGQEGRQARQAPHRRARVGALQRQGPPDQVQGAPRALRGDGRRGGQHRKLDFEEIQIPPGPAPGQHRHRGQEPQEGLRRPRPHRRPVASRCRATASSASSARTASARPRCSRRSSASSRSTPASVKVGETVKISLRRPEPRRHRPEQDAVGGRLRRARLHQGRQRRDARRAPTSPRSASRARTSRRRPACSPVVSATASTSR